MSDERTMEELQAEMTLMEGSIGRFATENSSLRRSVKKHYEAQRRLENAIRRHTTGACGCRSTRACLSALAKITPVNPRPKYGARIKPKITTE